MSFFSLHQYFFYLEGLSTSVRLLFSMFLLMTVQHHLDCSFGLFCLHLFVWSRLKTSAFAELGRRTIFHITFTGLRTKKYVSAWATDWMRDCLVSCLNKRSKFCWFQRCYILLFTKQGFSSKHNAGFNTSIFHFPSRCVSNCFWMQEQFSYLLLCTVFSR